MNSRCLSFASMHIRLREKPLQVVPVPVVGRSGIRDRPISGSVLVPNNLEARLVQLARDQDFLQNSWGTPRLRAQHDDEFVCSVDRGAGLGLPVTLGGSFLQGVIGYFEWRVRESRLPDDEVLECLVIVVVETDEDVRLGHRSSPFYDLSIVLYNVFSA